MTELIAAVLMVIGALLIFTAAVGIVRFPDVLTRMHATTKAGTLGIGLVTVSAMFTFGDVGVMGRAAGVILFVFLTAPISAHMISRAAYFADVKLWEGTFVDEFRGYLLDRGTETAALGSGDRTSVDGGDPDDPEGRR